jgi:hypothetical protein
MKAKVVVPLALMFLLLAAVPVYAAPPVIETGEINFDLPVYECSGSPGFLILDHAIGTFRSTSYYDKNGALLRTVVKSIGTDNLHKEGSNVALTGHFTSIDTYNGDGARISTTGTFLSITIPPYGKVVQIAGRVDYVKGTFAGVDTSSPETWAVICGALAGN